MKHPIKWVGSKERVVKELHRRLPATFGAYHEPFLGKGALFFSLHSIGRMHFLSDSCEPLMRMYAAIASQAQIVLAHLEDHQARHSLEHFREVRTFVNEHPTHENPARLAAAFIYLNRTCYNGLWRVNSEGKFNVPFGRYKKPKIFDPEAVLAVRDAFVTKTAVLRCQDFQQAFAYVRPGDFVYVDSPYHGAYAGYTSTAFTEADHARLAECVHQAIADGAKVLVSNSDTPFIRSLYDGLAIEQISARRSVSCKERRSTVELLIRNYSIALPVGAGHD